MWPSKHDEVFRLLNEDTLRFRFHNQDDENSYIETYDANIMGTFQCHISDCQNIAWSRQVAITIRMYSGKRYNARVYHQHCLKCYYMSTPTLDDSYAERVAYRLKKWSGIHLDPPPFHQTKEGPPHEKRYCEGCKAGYCLETKLPRSRYH
ncbi:zinc-binding domain-containing protein [Xylariaceae sp. AK1471]|nr:zinc-binding domain-containing protein [Xylariaceae sp. AK1471]